LIKSQSFISSLPDFPIISLHAGRRSVIERALVGELLDLFRDDIPPIPMADVIDIANLVTIFNRELFISSHVAVNDPFQEAFLGTITFQRFADSRMNEIAQTWPKAEASHDIIHLSRFMNSESARTISAIPWNDRTLHLLMVHDQHERVRS
jgi:hypothetical protein